jgi:pimeloyl-ACP methyl ester carboxylesterase
MYITDDGIKLHVELEKPDNAPSKIPLVIVIHGFTGHMEEDHIVAAAKACRDLGYATLRVDMYGHGKSEGEFEHHTLHKWISNALAIFDYAKTLDFVSEIYLCGHSQGGLLSMIVAPMERDVVKLLIPMSPAIVIPKGARSGNLLGTPFDPNHVPEILHSWDGRDLDGNYVRVAQTVDTDAAIKNFRGPVLLIHGDDDGAVPYSDSVDAAKKYENGTFVSIEGDDHCYGKHLDKVTEAIRDYLVKFMENR